MAEFGRDYEILVLDDASDDGTAETLSRYRRFPPLRIFREEERIGYGKALERLIRKAVNRAVYPKRDSIVIIQADFTESPGCIVSLVKTLEGGSDVVAGELTEGRERTPRAVRMTRWAADVELLTLAIRYARRIDEVPLEVRYDLRSRPSRVRPQETLMGLYRMRSRSWDLSAIRGEA